MANNNADIDLIASLDESASEAEILKAIKVLNSRLQANANAKIKLGIELDTKSVEQEIQRLQALLRARGIDITTNVNDRGIVSSVKNAMYQAKKVASQNIIPVNFDIKKEKLINDIKILGQQNSKLFSDTNMTAKYNSLLDSAKLATSSKELKNLRLQLSAMRSEIKATSLSGLSLGDTFKKTFKRATELFTSTGGVMLLTQQLRKAWTESLNLDKSFTDLVKVQEELSRSDYPDYLNMCNKKAQDLATTQQGLIEGATEFSKSGYDLTTSNKLTEKSTILSNVGEMNAADSAKAIISGVQAYDQVDGYTDAVDKAQALIDKYNEIGNTASITTAEIAQGVQRVGSVFADANTSVDEFIALLAAGNRQFQDTDSLSLGLRTAALRIRGCKLELQQMGEETDNVYTSASELQKKISDLTNIDGSGGVKILEADGETFRSIYDIFVDLSKVYQQMSDTDQSALLELIAGKHRASGISATLNNMTEAQEIYQRSLSSAGSAQEEYDKYLQSSEASLNKFRASMVETYQSVINGETAKGILDTGNAALQFANSLGLVESTLKGFVAIGAVKGITALSTAFKTTALQASNFGQALKMASNIPDGNLSKKFSTLKNIATASKSLTDAQLKQVISSKALNNEDRIRILRLAGMEKSLAEAKIAEYGLTQATNAQSTAQKAATINTFSFSAAVKGLALNLKMAFMSNPIGISIMALSTIIGAVSSKVSEYNEKVKETRQANIDAATSAKDKADELSKLYSQYEQLNSITNKTQSQEEQFKQAVIDITKALGDKASVLEGLTSGTNNYTEALKNATKAELESLYVEAKVGAKAAEEELQSASYSNWSGSKITIQQNEQMTGVEEHMAALNAVKDILKEYETLGMVGNATVLEWKPIGFDQNPDDMKAVVEYYQALIQARDKLVTADNADFLMSSDIYKDINTTINELSDSVEKYIEQQYQSLKLEYEWQNGIPTTEEEFKKMETSILNASGAGKEFQSILKGYLNEDFATFSESTNSINDIADAVDNATQSISNIKSFSQAWEELKISTEDSTKKLADDLTELAEKGWLTAETFSQTDTSGYFASLGISADEAVQKINNLTDAATQLDALSEQVSKMSDMLADKKNGTVATASDLAGFDVEVRGLDSWAEFEKVMGSTTSTIEECQAAANALASEWINNGNFLANLTDQNRDYYETQLSNMGIENAHVIVLENLAKAGYELSDAEQAELDKAIQAREEIYALQVAEAQDFIAKKDLKAAAEDAYVGLIKEAEGAGISKAALFDLIYQQNIFSNQKLNIYDKIAALQELGEAFGITADAALGASQAINLKNELRLVKHYGGTDADVQAYYAKIESQYQDAIKSKFANLSTTISPSGSSGYTPPKTKNGSDSKDSKQTIDWISRLLDVLQKKIDATKAKFDNLFTLKDKKNNLAEQITLTKGLLTAITVAADRYKKAADKVGLSDELKKKVENGSYDITEYDSKTSEKIQKYQEYLDQYNELKQQEEELNAEIRGLKSDKYQLDIDNAENNIAKLDAQMDNSSSYKERIKYLKEERDYIKDSYYYQIKQAELNGELVKADELRAKRQKELTDNTIAQYQEKVDDAEARIAKSQAYAELDAGNYKEQNKHLEAQKKYIEESYNWQIKIAKKKGETLEVDRLRAEKQKELNNLTKQEFDNIANTYDNKIGLTNNKIQAFQDQIDLMEARGQTVGSALYTKQMSLNKINAEKLLAEKEKLIAKLADFKKGSDNWYDAQEKLFSIDSELVQIEINNANLQKSINQLKFDHFDVLLNKLNDITSETDFLISMLDSDNFYDDSGNMTSDGITAMGMYAQKRDIYKAESEKYKEQMAELEKDYQKGIVDPETYESKMREYKSGQMDMAKAAEDMNKSIINLVSDGLEKQNQALSESIQKQKDLLRAEKDLKSFQDSLNDANKNVSRLERQYEILSGDDSEENRKRLREIKSQLEDAKKSRDDLLYDKSIEDREQNLDDMYNAAVKSSEEYLKDSAKILIDACGIVNANTETVSKNIERISKETGVDISENITNAWKQSGNAVSDFGTTVASTTPGIISQISLITEEMKRLTEESEKAAKSLVKDTVDDYTDYTSIDSDDKNSGNSSSSTVSSEKKYSLPDIDEFITKNMKEANNDKKYYAPLNQYIYGKMGGYVLSKENEKKLAEMLGVSLSTDLTGDAGRKEIQKILDALIKKGWKVNQSDIKGFAKGGLIDLNNAVRLSGEDGVALVRNGEYILSKPQTDGFLKLAEQAPQLVETLKNMSIPQFNYAQIDRSISLRNSAPQSPVYNIDNSITVEGVATNEIVKDMANIAKRQVEEGFRRANNAAYAKGVRWK